MHSKSKSVLINLLCLNCELLKKTFTYLVFYCNIFYVNAINLKIDSEDGKYEYYVSLFSRNVYKYVSD